uniref:Microfibril associated protein 2 n=1 Tax=Oryzias melastigma TaxID=30732 RepID=A0A3B3CAH5_ORYME
GFWNLLILNIFHVKSPETTLNMMSLVPDCREEQYPCTRLYSVHKPCKQCLNSLCFYSVRRMYVINKEICVRTVCAHEELLRGKIQTHLDSNYNDLEMKVSSKNKREICVTKSSTSNLV